MQEHSSIGERILAHVDEYSEISTVVRFHHERIDGQGYPDGLDGEAIPLVSRIIAVADAYNAMTSDRPYRDAMPSRVARLRLAQAVTASSTRRLSPHSKRSSREPMRGIAWVSGRTSLSSRRVPTIQDQIQRSRSRKSPDQRAPTRPALQLPSWSGYELVINMMNVNLHG